MTDVAIPESEDIQLPHTGELISLSDVPAVVKALQEVRTLEARMREAKFILSAAVVAECRKLGTKTMWIDGLGKVEVRGGKETHWDVDDLRAGLENAGMPDDAIGEIVRETVLYAVDARRAKRAAGANPDYARVIEAARSEVEKQPYVIVSAA